MDQVLSSIAVYKIQYSEVVKATIIAITVAFTICVHLICSIFFLSLLSQLPREIPFNDLQSHVF